MSTLRTWGLRLTALCLAFACTVHAQQEGKAASTTAPATVEVYAALPAAQQARLSPNGKRLAYIGSVGGRHAVVISSLGGPEKPVILRLGEVEPTRLIWKTDQRLLVAIRVIYRRTPEFITAETRLVALDADGSRETVLIQASQGDYVPQIQDDILSTLPQDPEHVMVQIPKIDRFSRSLPSSEEVNQRMEHPEAVLVDVNTGKTETIARQHGEINEWLSDDQGNVRLGWAFRRNKSIELLQRERPGEPWQLVHKVELNTGRVFTPLAFLPGRSDRLYVLSNHETGFNGLYEFDLNKGQFIKTVASSTSADVHTIIRDGHLRAYQIGRGATMYLDPDWNRDATIIDKALPQASIHLVDRSRGGARVLAHVTEGNAPGDFWLLDREGDKSELMPLIEAYPDLKPEQIVDSRWIAYKARDGLNIPAVLTLPTAYQRSANARPIPFVVLPHGGPSSHDDIGFDYWVQFLASRGYGVLQPQFRGSTGYGQSFLIAGYQQWGLAMQDDVTDGTKWLIDQKLADPHRIAIVGGSYGGYAALMGLVREPDLYRAAVAFAPVTDLGTLIYSQYSYLFGDLNIPQIGGDQDKLSALSPTKRADRIQKPVLLVHGRKDYTVPVEHTELLSEALRKAGKTSQTIYLDEGDHYLSRGEDRLRFLKALEAFLAEHLKP